MNKRMIDGLQKAINEYRSTGNRVKFKQRISALRINYGSSIKKMFKL